MGDLRDIVDKKFTLPAPGKLNLCLNILGRRPDGYHELQTAFQIISIADSISFELADSIEVICDIDIEPHQNLVYRAAKSLEFEKAAKIRDEIENIEQNIESVVL